MPPFLLFSEDIPQQNPAASLSKHPLGDSSEMSSVNLEAGNNLVCTEAWQTR